MIILKFADACQREVKTNTEDIGRPIEKFSVSVNHPKLWENYVDFLMKIYIKCLSKMSLEFHSALVIRSYTKEITFSKNNLTNSMSKSY